jgi:hypothetical protein
MSAGEGFIPYLVLVRFDKGEDLRDRLEESLPAAASITRDRGVI